MIADGNGSGNIGCFLMRTSGDDQSVISVIWKRNYILSVSASSGRTQQLNERCFVPAIPNVRQEIPHCNKEGGSVDHRRQRSVDCWH